MKPLEPFRPEPPPKTKLWKVSLALTVLVLGIGAALYGFHDAGAISEEVMLAIMIFVVAVCAGIIMAIDIGQQAHRDTRMYWTEIPPPFDFIAVWPPQENEEAGRKPVAKRKSPGSRTSPGSQTRKP